MKSGWAKSHSVSLSGTLNMLLTTGDHFHSDRHNSKIYIYGYNGAIRQVIGGRRNQTQSDHW